jgi:hypothetical protein
MDGGLPVVPLVPPTGCELHAVVDELYDQLREVHELLGGQPVYEPSRDEKPAVTAVSDDAGGV